MKNTLPTLALWVAAASSRMLASGCMLAACAASSDSLSDMEADFTVRPTDASGTLLVTTPANVGSASIRVKHVDGEGPYQTLTPGAAKTLSPGTYCLWTNLGDFDTKEDCRIEIAAGAHVAYALGAVSFTRSSSDLLFGIDWPKVEPVVAPVATSFFLRTDLLPHAAGKFSYPYGPMSTREEVYTDAIGIDVSEGKVTTVDLASTAGRSSLRLLPSIERALPTHPVVSGQGIHVSIGRGNDLTHGAMASFVDAPILFRGREGDVLVFLNDWRTPSQKWRVSRSFANPGEAPSLVQLGRLDVETVAVFMRNNTVTRANGSFSVAFDGKPILGEMQLGYGVDLLPGKYDVTVHYEHPVDGAKRSQSFVADVE